MQFRNIQEELALIQKGKPFYKGFYEDFFDFKREFQDDFDESFDFMDSISDAFESDELSQIDLHKYIHGYCDEFAMMLCGLYGYEIKIAFYGKQLIHAWCQKGEYFIDARGITNDEKLFFSEYYIDDAKIYTLSDVNSFIEFANEILAQDNAEFDIVCLEELEKLEKDLYMNHYYLI